jgi:hypothetical protein
LIVKEQVHAARFVWCRMSAIYEAPKHVLLFGAHEGYLRDSLPKVSGGGPENTFEPVANANDRLSGEKIGAVLEHSRNGRLIFSEGKRDVKFASARVNFEKARAQSGKVGR